MLTTLQGIFENGSIELGEDPPDVRRARVLVTFLPEGSNPVNEPAQSSEGAKVRHLELIRQLREEPAEDGADDFERFQREHPIRFRSLDEDGE